MHLKALELLNYRSYAHTLLRFTPGITVFVGANGQGKTNIVEALWYLATLSSHRVAHDAALVRRGEKSAIIRAMCERSTSVRVRDRTRALSSLEGLAGFHVNSRTARR